MRPQKPARSSSPLAAQVEDTYLTGKYRRNPAPWEDATGGYVHLFHYQGGTGPQSIQLQRSWAAKDVRNQTVKTSSAYLSSRHNTLGTFGTTVALSEEGGPVRYARVGKQPGANARVAEHQESWSGATWKTRPTSSTSTRTRPSKRCGQSRYAIQRNFLGSSCGMCT
eukprot:scaffold1635_cov229-Pinguiococcus_pyrenoidosus.AAC.3